jgi:hypothetical protein
MQTFRPRRMRYKRFFFARRGQKPPKFERVYHRTSLFNKLLVRYFGIEVDDALEIAEQTEV